MGDVVVIAGHGGYLSALWGREGSAREGSAREGCVILGSVGDACVAWVFPLLPYSPFLFLLLIYLHEEWGEDV